MAEAINPSLEFDQELSELAGRIEAARAEREKEAGLESEVERETIGRALSELVTDESKAVKPERSPAAPTTSYLNTVRGAEAQLINELIAQVPVQGLKKTISRVADNPALLDMFHDALVDFLYEELKQRNLI